MIKRASAALAVLLVAPAAAQVAVPDSPLVSATIKALTTGNLAELDWLVADSDSLQFPRAATPDRAEAFRLLKGCKARELKRVSLGPFDYYEFEWKCRAQTYVGKLIPVPGGKAVALVDLVTRTQYAALSRATPRVLMPPMPVRTSAPLRQPSAAELAERDRQLAIEMAGKKERAEEFAQAVAKGDLSAFQTRFATARQITYGFTDPYSKVEYTDRTWRLGDTREEAGRTMSAVVAHTRSQLGQPVSSACHDAYPYVECTWRYRDPGTLLKARIHIVRKESADWGLIVFEFRYETAAKLQAAKRRAGL